MKPDSITDLLRNTFSGLLHTPHPPLTPGAPQPLPDEMPAAYLCRVGHESEAGYEHYGVMRDALIVNQLACLTRRDEAIKEHRKCSRGKVEVDIGPTDAEERCVVFYNKSWEERADDGGWTRHYWAVDVEGVYDAATFEDITDLLDADQLTHIEERIAADKQDPWL